MNFAHTSHNLARALRVFRIYGRSIGIEFASGLLIICALLVSQGARAFDDVDFKPSGEFRARYFNDLNSTGLSSGKGSGTGQSADAGARLTTNILARKGETLQVFGSFLYNLQFGANNSYDGSQGSGSGANAFVNNAVLVNRAWGLWKVTNSVTAKVGRLGIELGDGSVFSENAWEKVPTELDGIDILWDIEVAKLRLIAIKTHEYSLLQNLGAGGAGPVASISTDPERNFYGVSADARNLPVFVKSLNVHAFQVNSDPISDSTSSRGRDNWQHYGLSMTGEYGRFGYHLDGAYQTGYLGILQSTSATPFAHNLSANMIDVEVSYLVPDWLSFKVALGGHRDTGSDESATTRTYQSLYYDRHQYAGLMDVVGWGNLTYANLVFTIAPREEFVLGLAGYLFSRTQTASGATFGDRYGGLAASQAASEFAGSRSLIGTELDGFAEKTFEGNFRLDGHATVFIPGAYLRDGSVSHNLTMAQIMFEATLPF